LKKRKELLGNKPTGGDRKKGKREKNVFSQRSGTQGQSPPKGGVRGGSEAKSRKGGVFNKMLSSKTR